MDRIFFVFAQNKCARCKVTKIVTLINYTSYGGRKYNHHGDRGDGNRSVSLNGSILAGDEIPGSSFKAIYRL